MHRQVGDLTLNDAGIAQKGLLVRHLVLPENMAGTRDVMRFIHHRISPSTYVNVMRQYRPCGDYLQVPALARAITGAEYERALQAAREEGITRFDKR
jgi:putative pyruvate formate lyase activating enzyme